ncbi:MAG TPA: GNAT family N-acetyltransferase [Actinomycetota bacterium]|nr:GNAT family N-acetyltransferase [Actinomycetota bacterium]
MVERKGRAGAGMAEGRAARPDPGPGVVVRPARRWEIPAVLALWREADAVPSISDDPASLRRLLDTSQDALLVAETAGGPEPGDPGAGGRLVGTIVAGWDGWRGNLYRQAVLPTERRRGIALRLVAEAERRLTAKGAVRFSALVMSEHDPAVALWLAAGYAHDLRVGRFVRSLR